MKRLAILDCEHVSETLDNEPEFGEMMIESFNSIGFKPEYEIFDCKRGDLPSSVSDFTGYAVMGSYNSAYDPDLWIYDLGNFIQDIYNNGESKLIGICFGHQMIGKALGGKVEKAPGGWGIGCLNLHLNRHLFTDPVPSNLHLHFSHADQVTILPSEAKVLAQADHCPNAMISVGNNILGLQAHPEFNTNFTHKLIKKHSAHFGEEVARKAIESLKVLPDSKIMLEILKDFLVR